MFKKIQARESRDINVVKIDGTDLQNLGLYLEEDFELSYVKEREVEEIYIPGRDMPYHKIVRSLPIELSISFNIKESTNFYARMDNIENFLENNIGKVITFNNESKGFKLYWYSLGDITRSRGLSTITITFQCYPETYSI